MAPMRQGRNEPRGGERTILRYVKLDLEVVRAHVRVGRVVALSAIEHRQVVEATHRIDLKGHAGDNRVLREQPRRLLLVQKTRAW